MFYKSVKTVNLFYMWLQILTFQKNLFYIALTDFELFDILGWLS